MLNLKLSITTIIRRFTWFKVAKLGEQSSLKAELLCVNQMTQHAKLLAESHKLNPSNSQDQLLHRLDDNERVLITTNKLLTVAVKAKQLIAPSGEWLLDNFYLIEEHIRTARRHFPVGYSRELPRLALGISKGLPRVYDIALHVISHGDGRVDAEALTRFIVAYQTVTPLKLGELWAIPIMIRLALIENLRRVSTHITIAWQHITVAQQWANQILEIAENDPKNLILIIADMARSKPPMTSAFVAELTRQLQGHGSALALPLNWIEQQLVGSSLTIEQLVQTESQLQAADQVSINNTIVSMRWLTAMDWRDFVEDNSMVEHVLRQDIAGLYSAMDFATRDSYRQVIDSLAKRSEFSEIHIARTALKMAHQAYYDNNQNSEHKTKPTSHVGYYLIDSGISQLEAAIAAKTSINAILRSFFSRIPLTLYLGSIIALTLFVCACLLMLVPIKDLTDWRFILLTILSLLAASQLASALVNWISTLLVEPKRLPRMDYSKGIPQSMQTLVVIPTMLSSSNGIELLLEALEVRFLGNRDDYIHFALLTDFHDALQPTLPEDAALLQQVKIGIEQLNAKYAVQDLHYQSDRFFLLHRPRSWNAEEHIWMGSERKRGKLADLNALLRSHNPEKFDLIIGDILGLSQVKYVITLDSL